MKKYEKPKFDMIKFESANDLTVGISTTLAYTTETKPALSITNISYY